MKRAWQRYCNWLAALAPRERALVCVAALALAGFVPFAMLVEPQLRDARRLGAQVERQGKALAALKVDVAALAASDVDPDAGTRARVAQLGAELRALDDSLRGTQKGLVPAERMAQLLERMLAGHRGLRLVGLRTLAAAPLVERAAGAAGSALPAPGGIFRHGVEITLEGSYADLTAYVVQLERLPTRMYWSEVALDAAAYPRVSLTLSVFTLGLEAAWLSV